MAVTISGLEQIQNSGKEQMIDLLYARIQVAEATFKNNLSNDVYSDGTASGGKQVTGLQAQVSTSPSTGTVGGIPAANYPFWRNQVQPGSGTTTLTDANMEGAMRALWLKCCRNNDKPDLITADNEAYGHFWASMTERQRFTGSTSKMANAGWNSMMFNSVPRWCWTAVSGARLPVSPHVLPQHRLPILESAQGQEHGAARPGHVHPRPGRNDQAHLVGW